jgi:predicted neuraminidase
METTHDLGQTWKSTGPLNDGRDISAIQPTILVHSKEKIQILCRSKSHRVLTSWSSDCGKTWSELKPTILPNPNSGIDGVSLKNGDHILVYNHINTAIQWGSRNILNLALSKDGISWNAAVLLEDDPDPDAEYSYPAAIQTLDGLIHITYTWNRKLIKHVVIDPSKLKTKIITSGDWPEE